jgi:hypothetical protein
MTNETAELIKQHVSPVFVATVLDTGDLLQAAFDAGYAHVVGVTTAKEDADWCRERFKGVEKVRIFHGEDIVLHEVIKDINIAVTFCLDSRSEPAPALIQELSILKHHRIKSHCIIVQNLSLLGQQESGFITFEQVRNAVRLVNDGYKFVKIGDNLLCRYP